MASKKLLKKWAKITNIDICNLSVFNPDLINSSSDLIKPLEMKNWIIRECDRPDYKDWMPYRLTNYGKITVYYINVNPKSQYHNRYLLLSIDKRIIPMFNEYENNKFIRTYPASIENTPSANKPTDNEILELMEYMEKLGVKKREPCTINGKQVNYK
ncbi:Hypothetical protein PACV_448 [Pacmanvirus A23]|uniref:Hypothetical protein n=1 Tax=Pacmanvirus A23 TaxID=1932881 RepID=UPI000A093B50|nr:Hypothetical protein B9W72_gp444 [Pacmanvirus A23]SIP86161.1 Hypothetical protein PACV_448 [Pacmanvirus A23]